MKSNAVIKNKMGMFDFVKGCTIFYVVFGHTIQYFSGGQKFEFLGMIFASFLMLALWMASAYWFNPKPVSDFVKGQIKNMIIPYLITEVVTWFCYAAIMYLRWGDLRGTLRGVRGLMLGTILGNKIEFSIHNITVCSVGPAWFIIMLFIASITLNLILNYVKDERKIRIWVWGLSVLGAVLSISSKQIFSLGPALAGLGTFYIGYLTRQKKILVKEWTKQDYVKTILISLAALILMGLLLLAGVEAQWVLGAPLGLLTMRISLVIAQGRDNVIIRFFKKLGRYIFWLLLVHTVEVLSVDWRAIIQWHVLAPLPGICKLVIILAVRWAVIGLGCLFVSRMHKLIWSPKRKAVV